MTSTVTCHITIAYICPTLTGMNEHDAKNVTTTLNIKQK